MDKKLKIEIIRLFQYTACPCWLLGAILGIIAMMPNVTTLAIIWPFVPIIIFIMLEIIKRRVMK